MSLWISLMKVVMVLPWQGWRCASALMDILEHHVNNVCLVTEEWTTFWWEDTVSLVIVMATQIAVIHTMACVLIASITHMGEGVNCAVLVTMVMPLWVPQMHARDVLVLLQMMQTTLLMGVWWTAVALI